MEQEILYFHFLFTDLQKLEPNKQNYSFFGENEGHDGASVTSLGEHEIIDWIFKDLFAKGHFLLNVYPDHLNCEFRLRVSREIFEHHERPGDIDILLWPLEKPELAVAIECKRVKVTIKESGSESVNKLGELEKGIQQANQLHEHRFWKTYIAFLIVTDGRHKTINNTLFRHVDSKYVQLVYNIPWNNELNSKVGILFVQLTQPTSKDFRLNHAFGICVRRKAEEIEQPITLTERIRNLSVNNDK